MNRAAAIRQTVSPGRQSMAVAALWLAFAFTGVAQTNTTMAALPAAPGLPDAAPSVLRVMGALALVLGLFLGGVWMFRNWQQLAWRRGRQPKLNVLEVRQLGGRQSLYVVGYEQGRFLVATSPAGVTLLTHLPDAAADEAEVVGPQAPAFAATLAQILKRK